MQSQPLFLPHKILSLKCCFQSRLADAAKIVRSWVLLSPRLVTLPLWNKDVIETPSQCTRTELGFTSCNKKTWRTTSLYSGKWHQQGHALWHGCKHSESGLMGLNWVRTPKPTLRWKVTQATLMKYKLVRFNLHIAGIKSVIYEKGSQISQVCANTFCNSPAQPGSTAQRAWAQHMVCIFLLSLRRGRQGKRTAPDNTRK